MPNALVEVEEGIAHVRKQLPRAIKATGSQVKILDVEGKIFSLQVGDEAFKLKTEEVTGFKSITGLDPVMFSRMSENLQTAVVTELLTRPNHELNFKIQDNDIVRVANTDVSVIDYDEFITRFVDKVQPIKLGNIHRQKGSVGFGLVTKERQAPPRKVEDVVCEGIYVSLNGVARSQTYNVRLACTNGMLRERLGQAKIVTLENLDETVDQLLARGKKEVANFVHLDEKPITNSGGLVGRLSRMHILNTVQVEQVTRRLGELPDGATEFDLINLITSQQHREGASNFDWLVVGGMASETFHGDHCSHCGAN